MLISQTILNWFGSKFIFDISWPVAQDVLGALGSNSVRGKIGGTPAKATAIGGETSQ